jgi:glycosyltransferase involved in cell wall biosynthesis
VSVIMPAYNAAAYLAEAVSSVQAQTYEDWELVIVDDASSDTTLELASSFGGQVRAFGNERNLGPGGTRNRAISQAGGELIALLDADDLWLPEYLERQVARFDSARGAGRPVGIVACNARIATPARGARETILEHFREPLEPVTLERVLRGNCIFISALIARQAGEEAGWFSDLYGTADHDLWIKILELGYEVALNREVLAVYRQPPGSISNNLAGMAADNQRTYAQALARGRLTPAQQRIARAQIRYSRAMEAVAEARFGGHRRRLLRQLPILAWVAASNPRAWGQWLRALTPR